MNHTEKQSVVSIVKSSGAEYDRIDFEALVERSLANLDTRGVPLPGHGTAFLKPNVVVGARAEQGVVTEPKLVAALIRQLRKRGVETVYVGDSSAGKLKARDTFRVAGMDRAVKEAGGVLVGIDDEAERVSVDLPGSDIVRSLCVPRKALEADWLLNFAKLKTHKIGAMTCCVKNWVGFLDQKVRLENHQTRLPKLVAELHRVMPAHLCFADALIVGEGDGPDLCQPRYLGAVLASNDPVALDGIGADLLHIHRGDLDFVWAAHLEGVGQIERNRIQVVGDAVESLAIEVAKPVATMYHRFPCNVVLGGVCAGCFAWFMGPALAWQREGLWDRINAAVGRPTFMLGFNAIDLNFEKHLKEGPYFVVGDCTPARFREDPRVVHIRGCCPGQAIPDTILESCGIHQGRG